MIELSAGWILAIVFAAIFVLILAGMRIAFALMVVGVICLLIFFSRPPLQEAARAGWTQLNSFTLTAVPLFIFMGQLMVHGQISEGLYRAVEKWLRGLPGGLAHVNIGSCAIFAALSGSSLATCAAIGSVAVPAMDARGYHPRLTLGSIVAGGTLGILIPPSVIMIIFGSLTDVSIGKLFIGGVIPGIMLTLAFMLYIAIWSLRSPSIAPRLAEAVSWKDRITSLVGILPALCLIFLVLGTIYLGVATPTEAAALGAFGALVITIAQRHFNWHMLKESLRETVYTTAMIGLIMAGAMIVAWVFHILRVPIILSETLAASGLNRYIIFALVVLMFYLMGCFIEGISLCIITVPVLFPIMMSLGFDPVWFGIVLTINIEVSLITPPVGLNLYVLKGIAPNAKMGDIIIGAAPYVAILTLGIVVLTIWPQLATWLPSLMMGA